jgi:hypothetical protein
MPIPIDPAPIEKGPNFNGIGAFDELRCWRRHGSDFAAVFAPASELTG